MQRFEFSPNTGLSFSGLVGRLADYLLPFAAMWRTYWLQAAAVRDGESWHLCHLALIGQWSEFPEAEAFCDYLPGGALIAVSQPIDESRFRQVLASLRESGTISLPHDITAQAPTQPPSDQPLWQEPSGWMPDAIVGVRETASWSYLQATGLFRWLFTGSPQVDLQTELRIRSALRADLERRSERDFETFMRAFHNSHPSQM